ncbi:Na+/H+ antiporter subunit E [Corynebacterium amycolatum]|uniref:Na+/H+ antiporter subunit E n=1 Tax=Corynebacterium TaxID=1716 RepID=UPI0008A64960|nr:MULTISPECIES: Na+/H+ antiporter subunit E [Corynebacterium]KAA9268557.1 Na+/H+ antiporter subunit E [Corynebacterium amycolatum]MBU5624672.1 Na+/H+ antiporter subunit E [Corynebacterium amycolatum]MEB2595933.1 Na+/H+ antiporter subunit E [Corynebacterium amycolatum]OFK30760.1 sodium:proton antiporter [Corynebacterium sp. HMSC064E08]OHR25099.1 sodium:proton antiporter [Corynebacterium sp. HMSC072B09]
MSKARARVAAKRPPRISILLFLFTLIIWVMLWGEVTFANVLSGILVATLLNLAMPIPPNSALDINFGGMVRLFGSWTIDFVKASISVSWLAIRRADPPPTAIIKVPMRTNDDISLTTAMALINLQPGGIIVDIDKREKTLTMHILDASSTSKVAEQINQLTRIERRVIRAFENRDVNEQPTKSVPSDNQVSSDKSSEKSSERSSR